MPVEMWSWILTGFGALTAWMIGSHHRAAWAVGMFCQLLWIIYSVTTDQMGFLGATAIYSTIYLRNWRRAIRTRRTRENPVEQQPKAHHGTAGPTTHDALPHCTITPRGQDGGLELVDHNTHQARDVQPPPQDWLTERLAAMRLHCLGIFLWIVLTGRRQKTGHRHWIADHTREIPKRTVDLNHALGPSIGYPTGPSRATRYPQPPAAATNVSIRDITQMPHTRPPDVGIPIAAHTS